MALPLQSLELHESHIGLAKKFVLPPHPLTPPPTQISNILWNIQTSFLANSSNKRHFEL